MHSRVNCLNHASDQKHISMQINGKWCEAATYAEVCDPYRGDVVAYSPVSSSDDCNAALAAAYKAKEVMAAMPGFERAALLNRAADNVAARANEIGLAMTLESGKALRDSIAEAQRAADTLRLYAQEAIRIQGEHIPMDGSALGAGKIGMVMRFPVGVVVGITPFNGPVNLAVHKLGPALAAGNSLILKPSPKAPWAFHKLIEAVMDAGTPAGAVNTLYGDAIAEQLIADPRVDFVSFTGSVRVGKLIRQNVGMKRVALELGGVGPTFIHHDPRDLPAAIKACARNSVAIAGQSCVSVQNVYVHRKVYEQVIEGIAREMDQIVFGDPQDPKTEVGTLIDAQAAQRVEEMVQRAMSSGATLLRGGQRQGALMRGHILTGVDPSMDIVSQEIFGPAMTIQCYDDIEPCFDWISQSAYGLQCGIYTNSLDLSIQAIKKIRTGGVIVNGTSRWRTDQIPYGGVKDSGIGREGAKSSTLDMTEERFFVFN